MEDRERYKAGERAIAPIVATVIPALIVTVLMVVTAISSKPREKHEWEIGTVQDDPVKIDPIDDPPPEPPPKSSFVLFGFLFGKSVPPEANPNDTFDTGIIVIPSATFIGSPIIVFTSTSSCRFFIEESVRLSTFV